MKLSEHIVSDGFDGGLLFNEAFHWKRDQSHWSVRKHQKSILRICVRNL